MQGKSVVNRSMHFQFPFLIGALVFLAGCNDDTQKVVPKEYDLSVQGLGSTNYGIQEHSRITKTIDGGAAIVYHTLDPSHPEKPEDILVRKYADDESLAWIYRQKDTFQSFGHAIVQCENGDLVIAGSKQKGSVYSVGAEVYLIRITQSGDLIWKKSYPSKWYDEGVLVTEISSQSLVIYVRSSQGDYLMKVQPNGEEVWREDWKYGCGGNWDMKATANDEFILSGPGVFRCDADGNEVWCYNPDVDPNLEYSNNWGFYGNLPTDDDQVVGYGVVTWGGKVTSECYNHLRTDYILAGINSQGTIAPPVTYPFEYINSPTSFDATSDGGFIMIGDASEIGSCDNYTIPTKSNLIKVGADGKLMWNYVLELGISISVREISADHYVFLANYYPGLGMAPSLNVVFLKKL